MCIITELKSDVLREAGRLARCIQSISDIKFRRINLQRGQFTFLTRIFEHPGINSAELSDMLKVDKATTTKAVQKLIKENYVIRKLNKEDKREWNLYPSGNAKEIYEYIIEEEAHNIEACFTGFSTAEQNAACDLLRRMCENIEQDWKNAKGVSNR